jgi:replicative DNA helicase
MTDLPQRIPPQSIEAEMCLLGSMLLDPTGTAAIASTVNVGQFYRPAHGLVFTAILALQRASSPVDIVFVRNELERTGNLAKVGGVEYIVQLAEGVPNAANAEYYAKIVTEKATLREIIVMGNSLSSEAFEPGADVEELIRRARDKVYSLTTGETSKATAVDMWRAAEEAAKRADDIKAGLIAPGLLTGIPRVDQVTGGMQPGDLWVLGGSTSSGKTALAVQFAGNTAEAGEGALCISAEMTRHQYANRVMQSRGQIDGWALRTGELNDWQRQTRVEIIEQLKTRHFAIVDRSQNMAEVQAHAQVLGMRWGRCPRLIVVDYLQLMRSMGGDNRAQEVSGIAWACKEMAMKLECSVLLLSQLDRTATKGHSGHPTIHNLKESGDIENHANVILLMHRLKDDLDLDGTTPVHLRVAKSRDGERTPWPPENGGISLRFRPRFTLFEKE